MSGWVRVYTGEEEELGQEECQEQFPVLVETSETAPMDVSSESSEGVGHLGRCPAYISLQSGHHLPSPERACSLGQTMAVPPWMRAVGPVSDWTSANNLENISHASQLCLLVLTAPLFSPC